MRRVRSVWRRIRVVFPGKNMAGHLGDASDHPEPEVVRVDTERQLLLSRGCAPVPKGGRCCPSSGQGGLRGRHGTETHQRTRSGRSKLQGFRRPVWSRLQRIPGASGRCCLPGQRPRGNRARRAVPKFATSIDQAVASEGDWPCRAGHVVSPLGVGAVDFPNSRTRILPKS